MHTEMLRAALMLVTAYVVTFFGLINASNVDMKVSVDTQRLLGKVSESFISMTLDTSGFPTHWQKLNFSSVRLRTLLYGLSPGYLRVGGSSADWLFFDKPLRVLEAAGLEPRVSVMTKKDFLDLVALTQSTGTRLLFDLNLQTRLGQQWDPSLAIELFTFCESYGIGGNIDWELGNEPDDFGLQKGLSILTGKQIGHDYVELQHILAHYHSLSNSSIFGPDIGGPYNKLAKEIILDVVNQTGDFLKALTFHHYYFRGDTATYKDYLNPENFVDLKYVIDLMKTIVAESKYPNIPLWLGESSDAWHSGTANVSDRFVSGFLWLEKLGLAAQMDIAVVMRQTLIGGNYALLDRYVNPNPDYWLTMMHNTLVGSTVLHVTVSSDDNKHSLPPQTVTTRVYAHCTNTRNGSYKPGAVTVFALNISPSLTSRLVFTDASLRNSPLDLYILSPAGPDGVLSKFVLLNKKQKLELVDDNTLPKFEPQRVPAGSPVILSPLTFGFFVFSSANAAACLG